LELDPYCLTHSVAQNISFRQYMNYDNILKEHWEKVR